MESQKQLTKSGPSYDELVEALYRMVRQHCTVRDNYMHSGYLSSDAKAMRLLGQVGKIKITNDVEKCVEANF